MEVFWLEAQPWDPVAAAAVRVRLCSVDYSPVVMFGYAADGDEWLPLIDGGPVFGTTVFNGTFAGKADQTRGELPVIVGAGEIDAWAGYAWAARPCKIWRATVDTSAPGAPVFPTAQTLLFDGLVESFDPDDATLALVAAPPNGKVASATYAGTGGAEGRVELKGVVKPYAAGIHKNRSAVLLDPGSLLFQVHGYGAISALTIVREGGLVLDETRVAQPSLAALLAATIPQTEIHTFLAGGYFRLGFTPVADITCDFNGHIRAGSSFSAKVGDLAYDMLAASGWDMAKTDAASFAAVNAANVNAAQVYDDSGQDIVDALTGMMASAGGYWDIDELGNVYLGLVQMQGAADFTIGDEGLADFDLLEIDHQPARAPFWRTRVGYGFNPGVMKFTDTTIGATPEQLDLIQSVVDLTDGQTAVFFANAAPGGAAATNDLWHDTDDGDWYKRIGGAWVLQPSGLGALGAALIAAAGAEAIADGKITSYFMNATPSAPSIGDLWTRPLDNPKVTKRWSGSVWDPVVTTFATVGTGPSTITVDTDSAGVPLTNELPVTLVYNLLSNGIAFTTGVVWSYRVLSGKVNGFAAASTTHAMTGTGAGSFVLSSADNDSSVIEITGSAASGASVGRLIVTIAKSKATPDPGGGSGGGGGPGSDIGTLQNSGFPALSSSSYLAETSTLNITLGAGVTSCNVNVALDFKPTKAGGDGSWTISLKVQRWNGSAWVDVGSVRSDNSAVTTDSIADDAGRIATFALAASFSFVQAVTGLTAASAQKFRLVAAETAASPGLRSHNVTGQVSVA